MSTQMLHSHPLSAGGSRLTTTHGQVTLWGSADGRETPDNNDNWKITILTRKSIQNNAPVFTAEANTVTQLSVGHCVRIQHINTGFFLHSTGLSFPSNHA